MPLRSQVCDDDDEERASLSPPHHSDSRDEEACIWKESRDEKDESKGEKKLAAHPNEPVVDSNEAKRQTESKSFGKREAYGTASCVAQLGVPKEPGACKEQGVDQRGTASARSESGSFDAVIPDATIVADVVNIVDAEVFNEEDIVLKRTDDIVKQVVSQLRENVDDQNESQKRKRNIRLVGGGVSVALVAVLVVVIVLLTRPKPPSPTPHTAKPNNTLPPNKTLPPINPCADFLCDPNLTIMELVSNASNHTLFVQYINRELNADLKDYLAFQPDNVTLFAPTDESFRALQPPHSFYITESSTWRSHLMLLLGTHILSNAENATHIFQRSTLQTYFHGFRLSVDGINNTIENDASIVTPNILASNGYIHVPDRVILSSDLRSTLLDSITNQNYRFGKFITKFRGLLAVSGLESTLQQYLDSGMTVFVPNDNAFQLLDASANSLLFQMPNSTFIKDFILYHVLRDNLFGIKEGFEYAWPMFNNVTVWLTNNNPENDTYINQAKLLNSYYASNGVLQIIDKVLLPPKIGDLLQVATNFITRLNVTTFMRIVSDHARLGNLFQSIVDGSRKQGHDLSSTDFLSVFVPTEPAFVASSNSNFIARLVDPRWLLHLQNLCLHHFTMDAYPDENGDYELTMLSGFQSTVKVKILSAGSGLLYSNQTIDDVSVEIVPGHNADSSLVASDGSVIRFIEEILLPPWVTQSAYDKLSEQQDVSTFYKLVQSSSFSLLLLNSTDDDSPLTVFAPNNTAMAKFENLTAITSSSSSFQDFVLRHVVLGNQYVSVLGSAVVVSVANTTLPVRIDGKNNNTYIGDAMIVRSDILASNGVVHVIDHVLQ